MRVNNVWKLFAVSAGMGFAVGVFVSPTWTDNVESAQVLAGVVRYTDQSNPMYLYHASAYSLLIQAAAVLLKLGASEWSLSLFFSGIQGALSFSALTLCAYAFGKNVIVSLFAPMIFLRVSQEPLLTYAYIAQLHGHNYPIFFPNHVSIYGVIGLYGSLLIFALFSLQKDELAAFALGLMPAIHITFAIACGVGVIANAIFNHQWFAQKRVALFRFAAMGFAIFVVTFAWQRLFILVEIPNETKGDMAQLANAFSLYWDDHNPRENPITLIGLFEPEYYVLAISIVGFALRRYCLPSTAKFLLIALLAISIVGITHSIIALPLFDSITPDLRRMSNALLLTRWLNLNSVAFPVMIIGLLGFLIAQRQSMIAFALLLLLATLSQSGIMISFTAFSLTPLVTQMRMAGEWSRPIIRTMQGLVFPLVLLATLYTLVKELKTQKSLKLGVVMKWTAMIGVALMFTLNGIARIDYARMTGIDSYTPILAQASRGDGMLIVGEEFWEIARLQIRTRRAILLDLSQLNLIGYVPQSAPKIERILNIVYGASLFDPLNY